MGIERHYIGGFTADPEKAQRDSETQAVAETVKKQMDFEKEFDVSNLCQQLYSEQNGAGTLIPAQLERKLLEHVQDMFSEVRAEKELKEELIRDELKKVIRMSGRKIN